MALTLVAHEGSEMEGLTYSKAKKSEQVPTMRNRVR